MGWTEVERKEKMAQEQILRERYPDAFGSCTTKLRKEQNRLMSLGSLKRRVHWVVWHTCAHLQRWGNLIKFSSIPTECGKKAFNMDIRHCFQGWKRSKPFAT